MPNHDQGVLNETFGDEAAEKLVTVYGDMLVSLQRLVVASALVVEAGRGERGPARLMQAAMSSLDGELGALRA